MNDIKKVKPKYNLFQNSAYAMKFIWKKSKIIFVMSYLRIPIIVLMPLLGAYVPKLIIDRVGAKTSVENLAAVIIGVFFATAFTYVMDNITSHYVNDCGMTLISKYKIIQDEKIIDLDYNLLEEPQTKKIIEKANQAMYNNHTDAMNYPSRIADLIANILGFVLFGGIIATLNPLFIVLLCATSYINWLMIKYVQNYEQQIKDDRAAISRKIWYIARQGMDFSSAKDIRLYGIAEWFAKMGKLLLSEQYSLSNSVARRRILSGIVDGFMILLRDGIAYAYLIDMIIHGHISVGDFVLYFASIGTFVTWISGMVASFGKINNASLQYCDIREFLEIPNKYFSENSKIKADIDNPCEIEFKNVSFSYPGSNKKVLDNLSFTIKKGEKLALVGVNGVGKTTIVKLLCGFYRPTEGEIYINGHEQDEYSKEDYYSLFSAVFQEIKFLPLSIASNVSLKTEEDSDRFRVEQCLKTAGLWQKVSQLTDGINTFLVKSINNNAVELSGGEQQKLLLARAIYKEAPILVLDEPTAALDPIAENEMYMQYNKLTENKTSIFISHRLASTRFCNKIILLDEGKIAETGTHDELMKRNGKYAQMFNIQSHYYNEEVVAV